MFKIKIIAIVLSLLLVSCATDKPELIVAEEDWVYEIRAINLVIIAPSDLNTVRGRPHSLAIGLYQMSDPNSFAGLSTTRKGAIELLQKGQIDDTIVNFQQITVRPGEQKKISIHRAQTAKYIGIIAGYFELNNITDIQIFDIPLTEIKRGVVERTLAFASLISDESKAIPSKLNVLIDLGRTGSKQIITLDDSSLVQQQKSNINSSSKKQAVDQQQQWFDNLKKPQ